MNYSGSTVYFSGGVYHVSEVVLCFEGGVFGGFFGFEELNEFEGFFDFGDFARD
jgi:hypothetical protein